MSRKAMFFRQGSSSSADDYFARVEADGGVVDYTTGFQAELDVLEGTEKFVFIPNGYKATKLYAQVPTDGTADITFARTTDAEKINSSGNYETVAIDVPRLDYKLYSKPQLLAEFETINLYINSETLSTQSNTIVNYVTNYIVSFYGTGTITFSGAYSGSLVGTGANDRVAIRIVTDGTTSLTSTVSGTVTKAQLEHSHTSLAGYYQPSSYIPTTGASASRTKEEFNVDIDALISTDFTMYWEGSSFGEGGSTARRIISLNSTDDADGVFLIANSDTAGRVWVMHKIGGSQSYSHQLLWADNSVHKVALVGTGTEVKCFVDGTLVNTKTGFTGISNFSTIKTTQSGAPFDYVETRHNKILLWDFAKTDGEAVTLTT